MSPSKSIMRFPSKSMDRVSRPLLVRRKDAPSAGGRAGSPRAAAAVSMFDCSRQLGSHGSLRAAHAGRGPERLGSLRQHPRLARWCGYPPTGWRYSRYRGRCPAKWRRSVAHPEAKSRECPARSATSRSRRRLARGRRRPRDSVSRSGSVRGSPDGNSHIPSRHLSEAASPHHVQMRLQRPAE